MSCDYCWPGNCVGGPNCGSKTDITTRADAWAAALAETARHIKAVEDGGGTVSGIDITFPPGSDVPQMDVALKLPRPLDGVTLQHARALLKVAA